jgi:uncharacterized membrane protein (UPF0127 family)
MQGARNPDTRIVLSIAFVDYAEPIVDAQEMKPLDDELPDYTSTEPARCALEVNRGFFEERSVEVGTRLSYPCMVLSRFKRGRLKGLPGRSPRTPKPNEAL